MMVVISSYFACTQTDTRSRIVDSFTRECLALEIDSCLSSRRVTRAPEWIIKQREAPDRLRCDNGLEFTSRHFLGWSEERRIQLLRLARRIQQRTAPSQSGLPDAQ
jgi:putative transposase